MIEGKGGYGSVGAGWAAKDLETVDSGARSATDVGAKGVVESYRSLSPKFVVRPEPQSLSPQRLVSPCPEAA